MKRVVVFALLALLAVYGTGRINLGESGALRFLAKMESMMGEGDAAGVCEMFHEDLEVSIIDHSGEQPRQVNGGKKELCELIQETTAGLRLLPHSMNVDYTSVTAAQSWSKPWTSHLSYAEHRALSIPGANVTLRTVSDDEITLVQTFSGVKLRTVQSEVFNADAT